MRTPKCSVIAISLLCVLLLPISTAGRSCCDPQCRKPISYARTTTRNVKREPGHVMYSSGAVTTVLAKAAGVEDGVELWEVEILGKRGLILSNALNEMSVMCETEHLVEVPDADPQVHETGEALKQPMAQAQDGGEQIKHTESDTFNPGQFQAATDTFNPGQFQAATETFKPGQFQAATETFKPGQFQAATDTFNPGQFQAATDTIHPSPELPSATDTPDLDSPQEEGEADLNSQPANVDGVGYNGGETHDGEPPTARDISNEKPSPTLNGQSTPNGRNIPNGAAGLPTANVLDQLQDTGSPVDVNTGLPPPKVPEHVQRWREQQQQIHQQQQEHQRQQIHQQQQEHQRQQIHQQQQEQQRQQIHQRQQEYQRQQEQEVSQTPEQESQEGETRPAQQVSAEDKPRTESAADERGHDREVDEGGVRETGDVSEAGAEVRVDQQTSEQSEAVQEIDGSQLHGDRPREMPGFQEEMEHRVSEEDHPRQSEGEAYTADPDQASKTIAEEQPPTPPPSPPSFVPVPSQTTPIAWGSTTEEGLPTESWNIKPTPLELHLEENEDDGYQITLQSGRRAKVSVREDGRIDVLLDDGKTFDVDLDYFDDLDDDILDFIDEKLLYDYDIDPELLKPDEEPVNRDEEPENWNDEFDPWNEESDHWDKESDIGNEESEYRGEEAEYKNDKVSDSVSVDPIPDALSDRELEPEPSLHSTPEPVPLSDAGGRYSAKKYLNLDAIRERAENSQPTERNGMVHEAQDTVGATTAVPNPDVAPGEGLPGSAGGGEAATAREVAAASEPASDSETSSPGAFHEQDGNDILRLREVPLEPEATAPPAESWEEQTTTPAPENLRDDVAPRVIGEEELDSIPYGEETPPIDQTIPPPPITHNEAPPMGETEEFDSLPFGRQPYTPETEERKDSEISGLIGTLASFLPTPLADWLLEQGPEAGLVAVVATSLAVLIPMCCSYCSARKDSRKKTKMLREQKTSRHQLEEQLKKLKEEHALLADRVREIEGKCRGLDIELAGEREAKAELEVHYQRLAASLATSQEEVAQYRSHVDQLNAQLAQEQSQLAAQLQEREVTLQQLSHLAAQLEEAGQHANEGDAARDQLEKEVFSVRDRLQELEGQHLQVIKELEETKERNSHLESQLASNQDEIASLREEIAEKDRELKTLSECLQEVMNPAGAAETSEHTEGVNGSGGERATETQLARIRAMLDTTRVQHELNEVTKERDQLAAEVTNQALLVEKLQAEVTTLKAQVLTLTKEKEEAKKLQETTDAKLKHLTEFFEEQSKNLHRQRFEEEVSRQAVETREAKAVEQATAFEEERMREKEELKELRKQMADIEKSLMQQVATNEKRAEEAQVQLRRTEQDLRQANREVTILKRSLAEAMNDRARALIRPEQRPGPRGPRLRPRSPPPPGRSASSYGPPHLRPRPPSTGPPGTRQPPRPLSTTRLPRTSSPGPDGMKPNEQETRPSIAASTSQPSLDTSQPLAAQPPGEGRQLPHSQSFDIPRRTSAAGIPEENRVVSQGEEPRLPQRPMDGTRSPRPLPRASYGAPPPGPGPSHMRPIDPRPRPMIPGPSHVRPTGPGPIHMAPPRPPMGAPPPPRPRGYRPPPRGFPPVMDPWYPPPPGREQFQPQQRRVPGPGFVPVNQPNAPVLSSDTPRNTGADSPPQSSV